MNKKTINRRVNEQVRAKSTNRLSYIVPKQFHNPIVEKRDGEYAPIGYTKRNVVPAEKAELVSMAKAMNADFEPKLRQLFNAECQAANNAIEKGLYIGYRCPEFAWDCIRVNDSHKCFCGHLLSDHEKFDGKKHMLKCGECSCKRFAFTPSRPEDVGEFWYARRRGFDVSTYRVKCKCKHAHDKHDPTFFNCKEKGCGCSAFHSDFLCAACDKHWEEHETFLETEKERKEKKLPYGEDYRPFNEMKSLKSVLFDADEAVLPINPFESPSKVIEYPAAKKRDDYILNIDTKRLYPTNSSKR